jgi:hypothetical protein
MALRKLMLFVACLASLHAKIALAEEKVCDLTVSDSNTANKTSSVLEQTEAAFLRDCQPGDVVFLALGKGPMADGAGRATAYLCDLGQQVLILNGANYTSVICRFKEKRGSRDILLK